MADIRKQKLEDYLQQLISEEFAAKRNHLKKRKENEADARKKQKKLYGKK